MTILLYVFGYACLVVGIALAFHKRPQPGEVDPNAFGAFDPPAPIYHLDWFRPRDQNEELAATPPRGRGARPACPVGIAPPPVRSGAKEPGRTQGSAA